VLFRSIPLLAIALLSSACAFGYYASGTLSDVKGELHGKAFPSNTAGGGRFMLVDSQGQIRCEGEMLPPDLSPDRGGCSGESGKGVVHCSDGRVLSARWSALSCRAFQGEAEDADGNRMTFRVERRR
jgi:hypothetical protein